MKWKQAFISLGRLAQNTKVKFSFESLEPLDIANVKAGCAGCTSVGKYKDNKLPVTFKTGRIPVHLQGRGEYNVSKSVIITYTNGEKETLKFTATIV